MTPSEPRGHKQRKEPQSLRVGANQHGFVGPDQVHLVVTINAENAHMSGPGTYDMDWVVHALNGLAHQWEQQQPMPHVEPPTPGTEPPGNWTDCTQTDLTVIFYRDCHVISMPGEVFADGLAEYTMDIVGRRRHEDDFCTERLAALAEAIAEDIAAGNIPDRECQEGCNG
jgi:hypothetical protein